jgi:hypothetical protein
LSSSSRFAGKTGTEKAGIKDAGSIIHPMQIGQLPE